MATVLVVDDSAADRRSVGEVLEHDGHLGVEYAVGVAGRRLCADATHARGQAPRLAGHRRSFFSRSVRGQRTIVSW
jgi:CheY-like chemotaxis protein